jgi:hypothetical protein
MFGSLLNDMRSALRRGLDAQARVWGGLAFMAMAMVAIQYDEIIAPEVHRLSDGVSAVASDMRSRLASFTL